jgi:hypothetical protein
MRTDGRLDRPDEGNCLFSHFLRTRLKLNRLMTGVVQGAMIGRQQNVPSILCKQLARCHVPLCRERERAGEESKNEAWSLALSTHTHTHTHTHTIREGNLPEGRRDTRAAELLRLSMYSTASRQGTDQQLHGSRAQN